MTRAARLRVPFAVLAFFTVLAGDVWRYTLGYIGWGVLVGVLIGLAVVLGIRLRVDMRRMPVTLLAFVAVAAASILWSAYPGATALGLLLLVGTTYAAVLFAQVLDRDELVDALGRALRIVIASSLAFELFVSTVIRQPVAPFWTSYDADVPKAFYWSREVLFEGGRIQGIVGNSNLLGMLSLLAIIVIGVQWASGRRGRVSSLAWLAAAGACFALTRSSTVIVATVVVAVVLGLVLVARRLGHRGRVLLATGAGVAAVAGVAVVLALRGPLLALLGRSDDLTGRLDIWAAVIDLASQRPVLGWGWVSYWVPWVQPFTDLVEIRGVVYLQAHNAWLDVWLQLGIPGLLAFAALVVVALVRAVRHAVRSPSALALLPLLVLTAYAVQSLAESRILIEAGWMLLALFATRLSRSPEAGVAREPEVARVAP